MSPVLASSCALLLTVVLELLAYTLGDAFLSRAGYVGARFVFQAVCCWLLGWQLMSSSLVGVFRSPPSSASPRPRRVRHRAPPTPSAASAVVAAVSATPITPAAYAARARAKALATRIGGSGTAINFKPITEVLEWPWESVMNAQREKARPPNDPLNPDVLSVTIVSDADAIEGGVRVRRRVRSISLSVERHIPPWIRKFLPAATVQMSEGLLSVPDARWAATLVESKTMVDYACIQEQSIFEVHPTNPEWTQWTGILDVVAGPSWVGKQAVNLLKTSKKGASASFIYDDQLKALRGRLQEMYPK